MTTSPVRVALLGLSTIAMRSVLPAAIASPAVEVVALASREPTRAQAAADSLGIEVGVGRYDEVLERDDVESVYLSVPTGMHAALAAEILRRGRHVLVEKPFATNVADARGLLALARDNSLVAMENLNYLQHPHVTTLLSAVRSGSIGTVRHVEAVFGFPMRPAPDIRYSRELGGGATFDSLIYPASLACAVFGEGPREQWSRVEHHPSYDVDARGSVALDFAAGSASLVYGWDLAYRNDVRVWGSEGTIVASRVFSRPPDLAGTVEVSTTAGSQSLATPEADHFQLMLERFAATVRRRDPAAEAVEQRRLLARLAIVEHAHATYRREHP